MSVDDARRVQRETGDLGAERRAQRRGLEAEEVESKLGKRGFDRSRERFPERGRRALEHGLGLALVRRKLLDDGGEPAGNLVGQSLDVRRRRLWQRDKGECAALLAGHEEPIGRQAVDVWSVLGRSLKTTNCLESVNALIEERCAKVDSWKKSAHKHRWLATALLDIEPRLRKVKGFKHLPKLREAIQRDLKIVVEQSVKDVA